VPASTWRVIEESIEEHLGSPLRRIQRATIDHVAIGMSAAALMGTAVWPTHCSLDAVPDRIPVGGGVAGEGRCRRAAQALRTPKANMGSPLRGPQGEMSAIDAGRLRSVLASRQAGYAHVRRHFGHFDRLLGSVCRTGTFSADADPDVRAQAQRILSQS
jgi:hypothetical protein